MSDKEKETSPLMEQDKTLIEALQNAAARIRKQNRERLDGMKVELEENYEKGTPAYEHLNELIIQAEKILKQLEEK